MRGLIMDLPNLIAIVLVWIFYLAVTLFFIFYHPRKPQYLRVRSPQEQACSSTTLTVKSCSHLLERRVGLDNHCSLAMGEGILLGSVKEVDLTDHRFCGDVIWFDAKKNVIKVDEYLEHTSHAPSKSGASALVLGAGTIDTMFPCKLGAKLELAAISSKPKGESYFSV